MKGVEEETVTDARIDVRRVSKKLALFLVAPVIAAIALDVLLGLWPIITLLVASLAFPIAGIVFVRTITQELKRVIDEVAPDDGAFGEESAMNNDGTKDVSGDSTEAVYSPRHSGV